MASSSKTVRALQVAKHVGKDEAPTASIFEFVDLAFDEHTPKGSALLGLTHESIDPWYLGLVKPGLYCWANSTPEGQVFSGIGVAKVIRSNNPGFNVGDNVIGFMPFQEQMVHDMGGLNKIGDTPPHLALSIFGGPALTAFLGLKDVGKPSKGDLVVVSAAAGSVGSIVGQICVQKGCKVIGFAGTDAKCAMLTSELGFESAINYKASADLKTSLEAAIKDRRVNLYWDNTAGPISDAVYSCMADHGRVVVCGDIATYVPGAEKGDLELRNHTILERRLRVEGILVTEFFSRMGEAIPTIAEMHKNGELKAKLHITKGFDKTVEAFLGLFAGTNTGKSIVEV